MIVLIRGKEPNSLLQFRKQYPDADYEDTPSHVLKDIREESVSRFVLQIKIIIN